MEYKVNDTRLVASTFIPFVNKYGKATMIWNAHKPHYLKR